MVIIPQCGVSLCVHICVIYIIYLEAIPLGCSVFVVLLDDHH